MDRFRYSPAKGKRTSNRVFIVEVIEGPLYKMRKIVSDSTGCSINCEYVLSGIYDRMKNEGLIKITENNKNIDPSLFRHIAKKFVRKQIQINPTSMRTGQLEKISA